MRVGEGCGCSIRARLTARFQHARPLGHARVAQNSAHVDARCAWWFVCTHLIRFVFLMLSVCPGGDRYERWLRIFVRGEDRERCVRRQNPSRASSHGHGGVGGGTGEGTDTRVGAEAAPHAFTGQRGGAVMPSRGQGQIEARLYILSSLLNVKNLGGQAKKRLLPPLRTLWNDEANTVNKNQRTLFSRIPNGDAKYGFINIG